MKLYNYNKDTKEFIFVSDAQIDPISKQPLQRANATQAEVIKEKEGFARVFNEVSQNWEYVEDNREKTVYNKETKEEKTITDLGEIDANYTELKPEDFDYWDSKTEKWITDLVKELQKAKEDKTQELNASAEQDILNGFQYINGRYYSYDSIDQSNFSDTNLMINNALILGQQDSLPLITWNSYEVTTNQKGKEKRKLVREKMTYDKFLELNTFAAFNHKLLILDKVGTLKEQVESATTVEEVEGILW